MSQKQLDEISNLLLAYSAGEYHVKGQISDQVDELDMIISGINMLGEELIATNVSRDFFLSIFNSVSDLVFIVNENGHLIDANAAVIQTFDLSPEQLTQKKLNDFIKPGTKDLFSQVFSKLNEKNGQCRAEIELIKPDNEIIFGSCTCSKLYDRMEKFNGFLVNIKDITEEKEKENLILRTIISTQQNEQRRVADDLHDSLGQELSMAQLMVSNLIRLGKDHENYDNISKTCLEILESSVKHLREICFDLMPSALIKGGLKQGAEQLVDRLKSQDQINISYHSPESFPRLHPDLEIAVYRIIQEFTNNMIKHAQAKNLLIELKFNNQEILIRLKDDGKGFNPAKLDQKSDGRGLRNMETKIKAFNGTFELISAPGKGTELIMTFQYPPTT